MSGSTLLDFFEHSNPPVGVWAMISTGIDGQSRGRIGCWALNKRRVRNMIASMAQPSAWILVRIAFTGEHGEKLWTDSLDKTRMKQWRNGRQVAAKNGIDLSGVPGTYPIEVKPCSTD